MSDFLYSYDKTLKICDMRKYALNANSNSLICVCEKSDSALSQGSNIIFRALILPGPEGAVENRDQGPRFSTSPLGPGLGF